MRGIFYLSFIFLILLFQGCASLSSFNREANQLIFSESANKPMRVLSIANQKDSLFLRKSSKSLKLKDQSTIMHLVKRMEATIKNPQTSGVGIAAPQVGVGRKLILVQRFDKKDFPIQFYINPEIIAYSQMKQDCKEGCLSIPNYSATTQTRAMEIELKHQNLDGEWLKEKVSGFTAVIFQHEIDHLDGILFLDHLKNEK